MMASHLILPVLFHENIGMNAVVYFFKYFLCGISTQQSFNSIIQAINDCQISNILPLISLIRTLLFKLGSFDILSLFKLGETGFFMSIKYLISVLDKMFYIHIRKQLSDLWTICTFLIRKRANQAKFTKLISCSRKYQISDK